LDHDLNKVSALFALLALKNSKGDFFVKTDVLKQILTLGCNHIHGPRALHSYELSYDVQNKTKGIYGHPLTLLFAGDYTFNDNLVVKTKIEVKDEIKASTAWKQQVDPKLKLIFSDEINVTNLFKKPANTNYNFGVKFEYTV